MFYEKILISQTSATRKTDCTSFQPLNKASLWYR